MEALATSYIQSGECSNFTHIFWSPQKQNDMATLSTLFDSSLMRRSIVMIVQSYGRKIKTSVFEVPKQNLTTQYLIIILKWLHGII